MDNDIDAITVYSVPKDADASAVERSLAMLNKDLAEFHAASADLVPRWRIASAAGDVETAADVRDRLDCIRDRTEDLRAIRGALIERLRAAQNAAALANLSELRDAAARAVERARDLAAEAAAPAAILDAEASAKDAAMNFVFAKRSALSRGQAEADAITLPAAVPAFEFLRRTFG